MGRSGGLRLPAALLGTGGASGGLVFVLTCGVITTLLAANRLDAGDYTVFAAFSGVLGILVLAPAAALEQDAALRARPGGDTPSRVVRQLTPWGLAVWLLTAVVLAAPVPGWRERLLGDAELLVLVLLVAAAPALLLFNVMRGHTVGRGRYGLLTLVHVVTGVGLVSVPLLLRAAHVDWLTAFLVGAALGYGPALLVLMLGLRRPAPSGGVRALSAPPRRGSATTWVVVSNALLISNLLAAPVVLRWHVEDVGPEVTASVQLLVSVSRLSTTAVLGFLPLVVALAAGTASNRSTSGRTLALGTLAGALAVGGCAVLGPWVVRLLSGRQDGLDLLTVLLATGPVLPLCPAVVLLGLALTAGRHLLASAAWSSGLLVLLATGALDAGGDVRQVLLGILLAAVLPLLVLVLGGAARPRGDVGRIEPLPVDATLP